MSPRTIAAAVALFAWPATSGAFQAALCPGDTWQARYSQAIKVNDSTIDIRTTTCLNHSAGHPSCGSYGDATPIGAKASMYSGVFSWCEAEAIAYDGMHEGCRTAAERCRDLGCGYYANNGTHYYDQQPAGTSQGLTHLACYDPPPPTCGGTGGCNSECEAEFLDDCGCCTSPIVIDVAANGLEFSNVENGVLFDIGGRGSARWVAWPAGGDDAWLARDLSGNGLIDDASELFGTATRLRDGSLARHGYAALAELDADSDGVVNAADSAFSTLLLWTDRNRNGVSEPKELARPTDLDITGFSVGYELSKRRDKWGNLFGLQSRASASAMPRWRDACDVFLLSESPFQEQR